MAKLRCFGCGEVEALSSWDFCPLCNIISELTFSVYSDLVFALAHLRDARNLMTTSFLEG